MIGQTGRIAISSVREFNNWLRKIYMYICIYYILKHCTKATAGEH